MKHTNEVRRVFGTSLFNYIHSSFIKYQNTYIIFFFLVLTLIFNYKIIFKGLTFMNWDNFQIYYPIRYYLHNLFVNKVFYLWNPYQFCGMPLIANYELGIYYPFNFLYNILPIQTAAVAYFVLHIFLIQISMYYFLKYLGKNTSSCIIGAVFWGFCSYTVSVYIYPHFLAGPLFIPILLLNLEESVKNKKNLFIAILIMGVILLAGSIYISYYTFLITVIWAIYRLIFDATSNEIRKNSQYIYIYIYIQFNHYIYFINRNCCH